MAIFIVGLGPGDGRYLTRQAWDILNTAQTVYLRTERHPAVQELPDHLRRTSFDHIYEQADSFEQVYETIVERLLDAAQEASGVGQDVFYLVPGHPLMGESTVTDLLAAAEQAGMPLVIVPGLSFVESVLTALGVDGLAGLQLFDAVEVASRTYPPLNTDVAALLGQLYDRGLANELKLTLTAQYPEDHPVTLVHQAGTADQALENLALYEIDRSEMLAHLTSLYVPPLDQRSSLESLAETVAFLRGPHGCPWDQEQTPRSMRAGLLEEASEVLEALDAEDADSLLEELGDLLYHLVFQAQMATESEAFTLPEVIGGIEAKLRRRHPHVWGDWEVADSHEVLRNWEMLKENEKSGRDSILDGVAASLPGLARAQMLQLRVARVGFDWPDVEGVVAKVQEELAELGSARSVAEQGQELGDSLFALVNWSRWLGIDAESALREANGRFERRFRRLEEMAAAEGTVLSELNLEQLDRLWEAAKAIGDGE
jgi:tetrapyrrole methylase family protein / MazG family protein